MIQPVRIVQPGVPKLANLLQRRERVDPLGAVVPQEYIEQNIIPRIEAKAVFLNWSNRSEWKKRKPLEAKALFHWGGSSEFNPMAIVFVPGWKVETVRFHQAFKDYKHGKNELLKEKEEELYGYL